MGLGKFPDLSATGYRCVNCLVFLFSGSLSTSEIAARDKFVHGCLGQVVAIHQLGLEVVLQDLVPESKA